MDVVLVVPSPVVETPLGASRGTTGFSLIGDGDRPCAAADEETDRERANTRCVAQMSGDDDLLLQQNDLLIPQDIVAQTCLYPLEIRAPEAGPKPADRAWRRVSAAQPNAAMRLSPSSNPSRPPSPAQPRHQRFSRHATWSAAVEAPLISPLEGVRKQVQCPRHSRPVLRNLGGLRFQQGPCQTCECSRTNQDRSNLHGRRRQ